MKAVGAAALALLLIGFGTATWVALSEPLSFGDFTWIWGLKARAIERSGSLTAVFRVDPENASSHTEYPLAWPLLLVAFAKVSGGWDELRLALLRPALVGLGAWATFARTSAPQSFRLLAAAAFCLLPYLHRSFFVGYAELLLVVSLMAAAVFAEHAERQPLALVAFLASMVVASSTKNEGAVAGLVFAALLLAARRPRSAALVAIAVGISVVPWTIYRSADSGAGRLVDFGSAFHPSQVVDAVTEIAAEVESTSAFGVATLLALVCAFPTRRRVGVLAAALVYVAAFVVAYGFSRRGVVWHVKTSFERIPFAPIALVLPEAAGAAADAFKSLRKSG